MRRDDDDQGFSLIDLMVSGAIMSVVLAVVLTATIQIYSGANRIDQTSAARDQLDISFRRLDRELRYATWTNVPGQKDGKWYLEYALPAKTDDAGVVVDRPCRQLIFGAGVLALASWNLLNEQQPVTPPTTLASGVSVAGGGSPYVINAPNAVPSSGPLGVSAGYVPGFQQVRLKFDVRDGKVTLPFDGVFTSLNIDKAATEKSNDCRLGRP